MVGPVGGLAEKLCSIQWEPLQLLQGALRSGPAQAAPSPLTLINSRCKAISGEAMLCSSLGGVGISRGRGGILSCRLFLNIFLGDFNQLLTG